MRRIADLMWEGFTLKQIFHKKIVIPYLLFLCFIILFEVYLIIFLFTSLQLVAPIGYKATFYFYGIVLFLIFLFGYSIMVLIETVKGIRRKKGLLI
ncbi:hypothetical protein [Neobacillus citreus]|uniref:Uncharacterized protein n=1 Tax=Neobacillus citreus TaxID=2833578 RepID=A0A942T6B0_9BACI|nr:hypothetical protein [Neobacillus citreus]MCH6267524.1 hypothetical protein [Neobacillus citreus]